MVRIGHGTAHIAAVRIVVHLVVVRRIGRNDRRVTAHRGSEGIGRVVALIHPAVKVIAGLVVRCGLRRNLAVVRDMIIAVNHFVCVCSVRVRRILHLDLVLVEKPLCLQLLVAGERLREVVRCRCEVAARVLLKPTDKEITGLISGRRCARARRSRCRRRTAALNAALRRGRHRTAVRIEYHLILRQLIVVGEGRGRIAACNRGEGRTGTVLYFRCDVKVGTVLRNRITNGIHRRIVSVSGLTSLGLLHFILIDTRKGKTDVCGREACIAARQIRSRNAVTLSPAARRRSCRHRVSRCRSTGLCLQGECEGLCDQRRCLTRCNRTAITGQCLPNLNLLRGRGHRCPLCIEIHDCVVLRREVDDTLRIRIVGAAAVCLGVPTAEDITRTRECVAREVLCRVIDMVGVRHGSACIRCVCVVANLVRIRCVGRMNGLILRDRLRKVVRIVGVVKPTVEVITGLVLRPCRLRRRSAVRHIVLAENLLVCVRRVGIRRIRHHHRELLQFPLCLERIILLDRSRRKCKRNFSHSARYRIRNLVDPALEVVTGLITGRTALPCRRCGLTCIVTVLDRLRCRRHIAALGIKAHLIARQIVGIVKDNLTARRCRRKILDAALRR